MSAPVNIFDPDLDSRDADIVLLARMDQLADPAATPYGRYVSLILSVIKSKITYVLEQCRAGEGVNDDELFDASLWLKEIEDIDITNRQLIEIFRASVLAKVAEEDLARGGKPRAAPYKAKWKPKPHVRKAKKAAEITSPAA